jgi:hypothetical protein
VVGVGNALTLGDGVGVGALVAVGLGREGGVSTAICVGDLAVGDLGVQATKAIVTSSEIMLAVFAIS